MKKTFTKVMSLLFASLFAISALSSASFASSDFYDNEEHESGYMGDEYLGPNAEVRFYRDAEMTQEYENVSEIKEGDTFWYKLIPADGYVCNYFKVNFVFKTQNGMRRTGKSDPVVAAIAGGQFEYTAYTRRAGDVNCDGALNAKDVTTFMKYLVEPTSTMYKRYFRSNAVADADSNGRFNAKDVVLIMKALVGADVKLCENCRFTFDCYLKADALCFVREGEVKNEAIGGYSELEEFLKDHGGVPDYLTLDYYNDQKCSAYFIHVIADPSDADTFPRLRVSGGEALEYEPEYVEQYGEGREFGLILYLVYYD